MTYRLFVLFFITFGSIALHAASPFYENPNAPWGVDSDLTQISKHTPSITSSSASSSKLCTAMIRFFQIYISPIDGPRSHFYPTSSQYALLAIQKHGVFKGIAMGCDRLMRENGEKWVYPITTKYGVDRKIDLVK